MRDKHSPLTRDIAIIKQKLDDLSIDLYYALFEQLDTAGSIMDEIKSLRAERDRLYDMRNSEKKVS